MIRTIIFDLGKVLIPFDFKRSYARMAQITGYQPSEIPERLRNSDLVQRFESGMIEPEAFARELSTLLDLNCSYVDFCEIWTSIFLPDTLIPESLLDALRTRYRLVLLSNTNAIHFEMLERSYAILQRFDEFVLSHRIGAMKPSPKIFEAAVRAAQCKPEECFFTDDIAEYVEGARQYGIDAVQFQSAEQIQQELRARNVRW